MFFLKIITFFVLCYSKVALAADYDLIITSDSPIAEGTSVTFNVTLLKDGKIAPIDEYQFRYKINDGDEKNIKTTKSNVELTVNAEFLKHGTFTAEIAADVFWLNWLYMEKTRKSIEFVVTNMVNGNMELVQGPNNTVRDNGYVSSQMNTVHKILISDKDMKLYEKAAYVRVYWFVDCLYVGVTDTLSFENWYRTENGKYNVEAVLMLSYEPFPNTTSSTAAPTTTSTTTTTPATTTTSTTTPTTTTTSTAPTTTSSTTSTTTTTTTKKPVQRRKRDATSSEFEWNVKSLVESGSIRPENIAFENMTEATTTQIPMEERIKKLKMNDIPYFGVCTNNTKVVEDPKKIYGYYQRTVTVENPVANVSVANNIWLKHGDMCQLDIKFSGTSPFKFCYVIHANDNSSEMIVNDEECERWETVEVREYLYRHFFPKASNSYTLAVFIKNEVSMIKTPIGVNFYEAQPRSQLSVVLVPVACSLVAVVLIVFGVAYYVQNRNQFLVEVADFNFGETQSVDSLEYKSFFQRLLDSISDLFIRHNYNDDLNSPGGESSNQNYNSMR